ncbi:MAG: hypothetical protein V2A73_05160 [Pseudomonadota bacterium]
MRMSTVIKCRPGIQIANANRKHWPAVRFASVDYSRLLQRLPWQRSVLTARIVG